MSTNANTNRDRGRAATAPPRPTATYTAGWTNRIPEELKSRPQWVVWRFVWRVNARGVGKWTKAPFQPRSDGRRRLEAKAGEPGTWGSFAEALAAYEVNSGRADSERLDGIGYEFLAEDNLVGVDYDKCITEGGELLGWAAGRLEALGATYAEISPSGTGLKAFYRGNLPPKKTGSTGRRRGGYGPDGLGEIEAYDRGRYFTVTGDTWYSEHTPITAPPPGAIEALAAALDAGRTKEPKSTTIKPIAQGTRTIAEQLSDDELLTRARRARNGAKFSALYDAGDNSGNPSSSEADCSLLTMLAFWTNSEPARMERLFSGSALASREKWTRQDYRDRTIAAAIEFNQGKAPESSGAGPSSASRAILPAVAPFRVVGNYPRQGEEPPDTGQGAPGDQRPNEAPDDPSLLARLFLNENCRHPDGFTLRYWQDNHVEWDDAYRDVSVGDIRARLHRTIKAEFDRLNIEEVARWHRSQTTKAEDGFNESKGGPPKVRKVTGQLVSNAVLALSGYTRLEPRTLQPSWLGGGGPFPADHVLPARNALVHLPGFVAQAPDSIHLPTPRFFCPYALDYDFDAYAPAPALWIEFLNKLWPGDPGAVEALQEWFGHMLTPDTSHQKIMMLIGPKRSGKGTIIRILTAMLGKENVANPTFASLSQNFGLSPLIGKPAAIITDARLSGKTDVTQIVERLLTVSGEDAQTIDRKHREPMTLRLKARFTIISNELPRLIDTSGALASRFIVLGMKESFLGREDKKLTDKLVAELPGILLWAIEGWRRLRDRGHFVQPESGKGMVEQLEELASPVGTFVKERVRMEAGAEIMVSKLYAAWKEHCLEHGRENPGDDQLFGRNLRTVLPNLTTSQPRQTDGTRPRVYMGIRLVECPVERPVDWTKN